MCTKYRWYKHFNFVFNDQNFVPGDIENTVALHELGHALGLKHPDDDGGNGRPTFSELGIADLDNQIITVMSNNRIVPGLFSSGNPATLMPLDILALQTIYGANTSFHTGNNTYILRDDGIVSTIWDAGGIDTIDASNLGTGETIDLRPFSFIDTFPFFTSITAIAFGGTIENAIGTQFADTLIGNGANNNLNGWKGADVMKGGLGNDTLVGGNGNDDLRGGPGNDVLTGGVNRDRLNGGGGDDNLSGGGSNDVLLGASGNDILTGGSGNDVLVGGNGDDNLDGGIGDDRLFGNRGGRCLHPIPILVLLHNY